LFLVLDVLPLDAFSKHLLLHFACDHSLRRPFSGSGREPCPIGPRNVPRPLPGIDAHAFVRQPRPHQTSPRAFPSPTPQAHTCDPRSSNGHEFDGLPGAKSENQEERSLSTDSCEFVSNRGSISEIRMPWSLARPTQSARPPFDE
jgi:hypothetical protein